jgi:hypothetical protein
MTVRCLSLKKRCCRLRRPTYPRPQEMRTNSHPVRGEPAGADGEWEREGEALRTNDPDRYLRILHIVQGYNATYETTLEPREDHLARLAFVRASTRDGC